MSDDFKMAPCPALMSDTGIHALELWKDGPVLPNVLNPETMFSGATERLIDLQRKYDFEYTQFLSRPVSWMCRDRITFDPDPESDWHIIGYGDTREQALMDVLEQIAYLVARS
jgi:hypothetical protein